MNGLTGPYAAKAGYGQERDENAKIDDLDDGDADLCELGSRRVVEFQSKFHQFI